MFIIVSNEIKLIGVRFSQANADYVEKIAYSIFERGASMETIF